QIDSGDEAAEIPTESMTAIFDAGFGVAGFQVRRIAADQVPRAAVRAPAFPFVRCDRIDGLDAQVDANDVRLAQQEFIAQVRALVIQAVARRETANSIRETEADVVVRIDEIVR